MKKTDHKKLYRSLLEDYFNGTLDDEFAYKVRDWLPASEHHEHSDRILKDKFEEFVRECTGPAESSLKAWVKICKELGFLEDKTVTGRIAGFTLRRFIRKGMRVAAVLLLPLLIIGGYLILRHRGDNMLQPEEVAVVYNKFYSAPADGKKKVVLEDGTEVFLNSGAMLELDSTGYLSARNVRISGEAYFSVVQNRDNPFIVDAGDLTVTVLGTEFNVKTGLEDGFNEVSLFSGSVEIRLGNDIMVLEPAQQLLSNKEKGINLVKDFDQEQVGNWRLRLDLDNVGLPKAFRMIEDHFGRPVVVDGTLPADNSIRVSFREPTIDEAMDIIQMITHGFDYRIVGDTILVKVK